MVARPNQKVVKNTRKKKKKKKEQIERDRVRKWRGGGQGQWYLGGGSFRPWACGGHKWGGNPNGAQVPPISTT